MHTTLTFDTQEYLVFLPILYRPTQLLPHVTCGSKSFICDIDLFFYIPSFEAIQYNLIIKIPIRIVGYMLAALMLLINQIDTLIKFYKFY